jgi:16S rRNA processing protein RimM
MADQLLEVGRIARAHGLQGEVVVELVTNRIERLAPGSVLVSELPALGPAGKARRRDLKVVSTRPHQHRYIVVIEGVSSREAAEALHGARLLAAPAATDDGEGLYVHDLIGSEVFERSGVRRGVVTAIEANPASDLLVVEERWYVPMRFVVEQSAGRIVVEVPEGLFE